MIILYGNNYLGIWLCELSIDCRIDMIVWTGLTVFTEELMSWVVDNIDVSSVKSFMFEVILSKKNGT